jgi:hypothetical protein
MSCPVCAGLRVHDHDHVHVHVHVLVYVYFLKVVC